MRATLGPLLAEALEAPPKQVRRIITKPTAVPPPIKVAHPETLFKKAEPTTPTPAPEKPEMATKKLTTYPQELIDKVLASAEEIGVPKTAEKFKLAPARIYVWRKKVEKTKKGVAKAKKAAAPKQKDEGATELAQLRAENKRLRDIIAQLPQSYLLNLLLAK